MARVETLPPLGTPVPGRLTPAGAGERIELIDAVRGFALYGVLLANLVWIIEGALTPERIAALPTATIDRLVKYGVEFLVDWKFYTLFSFLFGLGFSVQLTRGERRGVPILGMYTRRLLVLLAIGVVHSLFVWYGDILSLYALLGFVLILFRKSSNRTLLVAGIGLGVLLPAAVVFAKAVLAPAAPGAGATLAESQVLEARYAAFLSGSYAEWFRENLRYILRFWIGGTALYFLPAILGKFLLGFYAGRRGLLEAPEEHLALFRRLALWGFAIGVAGNAAWVATIALNRAGSMPQGFAWVAATQLAIYVGVIALSAFYLASLVLLWQRPAWRTRLARLAPVGRMALTNYLTHSLIYQLVFYGFGLGLLGRVGYAFCLGLSVIAFAGQMAVSAWWLRRYRFGPAEWLWRSLTYGARQSFRIRERAVAA